MPIYDILKLKNNLIYIKNQENNEYYKKEIVIKKQELVFKNIEYPIFRYIYWEEEFDFLFFGIQNNLGSRKKDSSVKEFPDNIRKESLKLTNYNTYPTNNSLEFYDIDTELFFSIGKVLDLGNIKICSKDEEQKGIKNIIKISENYNRPYICVGGDHTTTYYNLKYSDSKEIIVWDFDAHNDLYPKKNELDHGNVFSHISKFSKVKKIIQIGSRGFRTRQQIESNSKVIIIPKEKITLEKVNELLKEYRDFNHYISIDMDVLDPIYFQNVDYPVNNGLKPDDLKALIVQIFGQLNKVIGIDLVEANNSPDLNSNFSIPLDIILLLFKSLFEKKEVTD